jgi:hypothetical protein
MFELRQLIECVVPFISDLVFAVKPRFFDDPYPKNIWFTIQAISHPQRSRCTPVLRPQSGPLLPGSALLLTVSALVSVGGRRGVSPAS